MESSSCTAADIARDFILPLWCGEKRPEASDVKSPVSKDSTHQHGTDEDKYKRMMMCAEDTPSLRGYRKRIWIHPRRPAGVNPQRSSKPSVLALGIYKLRRHNNHRLLLNKSHAFVVFDNLEAGCIHDCVHKAVVDG